jgi:hypothetical protein
LAKSLEILRKHQNNAGVAVLRSSDISRTALEKPSVKLDIRDFTRFIAGLVKIDNPTT